MKRTDINIRDPFVLVHEGAYYLYGTRGATCWGPADGFDVYVSRDLDNWDGPFVCFHNDGSFWADRNYWAPEVHEYRGAFYMFPCIKSTGMTSDEFCEKFLLSERVAAIPGTAFGPGGEGFVRMCYATSMEDLNEAMVRLKRFLGSL